MAASGNIVGEVGLIVKPVDPGFSAGVQRIIDKIERDAQFKVAADTQQAQAALNGLDSQVGNLNNSLVQSAVNVAGITAAFFALKGAANQVVGKFSTLFDQLAQAKAGFSSILKSENAGNNLLTEIQEFARVSPFVTQELVNYSQQLLGVGLSAERITPLLEDVGNIISSVGGDTQNMGRVLFTLTQIQSIGRLAGQDAMQLQSALIPITKYLSEYLNKTTAEVKKLQEQGKISADTVFAAIAAQGDNVKGAMDKATRNIAGARAILSDTITLMLQRSPELQGIFDDIFKSIITFSNYLSRDDVSLAIANFLASIGDLYDGLKPLMTSISEIGSNIGISSLRSFTAILNAFATAISAIPQPVLTAIATWFVAMATLKAPLVLAKYIISIRTLSQGVMEAGIKFSRGTVAIDEHTMAAREATIALERLAVAEANAGKAALVRQLDKGKVAKYSGYAGMGLAVAGTALADGEGGTRDALGTMGQYAGMGAAIGGPWGAVAGGAIGAFAAIGSASKKASDQLKKDAQEAADAWGKELGDNVRTAFDNVVNEASITEFLKEADKSNAVIENLQRVTGIYAEDLKNLQKSMTPDTAEIERINEIFNATNDVIDIEKQKLDALFETNPEFLKYLDDAAGKLALLSASNPEIATNLQGGAAGTIWDSLGFGGADRKRDLDLLTGQITPKSTEELMRVNEELAVMGITLDDLVTKTDIELQKIVELFLEMPDAIRDSLRATNEWLTRLKDAKLVAETMWQPEQDKIAAIIGYNNALTGSLDAQEKAAYNLKDTNAQLMATSELAALKEQVYNRAIADNLTNVQALALAERAYAAALEYRSSATSAATAMARFADKEMVTKLLEIGLIADDLDNREIVLRIATEGVDKALADVQKANESLITVGALDLPANEKNRLTAMAQASVDAANAVLDDMRNGKYDDQFALMASKEIWDLGAEKREADAKRAAEEAARVAEAWANSVKSATESLTQSIDNAAGAIKEAADNWVGSIKERTQYEQSVSVGRLTRNANRQIADIAELTSGISNLKGRGVPQSVIDALGINNVSDTRQLRKLVNSSDADLMALTASLATLDSSATALATSQEDKRTRDNITAAIVEAAAQLDLNLSKEQAAGISNQFNIAPGANAEEIALQILNILTSGRISA